ncbi:MAG: GAF domain-containing protein [Acidobacteria bacterium]|nr:GAF domain-containing protein [Acidobacteriota bacterium]
MCTAEGKGRHYPVDEAGVWVDAIRERSPVIHNDYASLVHRKGLPPGHPPVLRELVIPILRGQHVVGILGVGNKPGNYGPQVIESVSRLGNLGWDIVQAKQAEEELRKSEGLLAQTQTVTRVGGWEYDVAARRNTWTDEVYRIYGVDRSAFDPNNIPEVAAFFAPEDQATVTEAFRRAVETGELYDLELEFTVGHRLIVYGHQLELVGRMHKRLSYAGVGRYKLDAVFGQTGVRVEGSLWPCS